MEGGLEAGWKRVGMRMAETALIDEWNRIENDGIT